jgi:vancomycin resistance protein YoaR
VSDSDRTEDPTGGSGRAAGRRTLLTAGAIVAGAAAFYAGMLVGSTGDIPANTTVLGVQIGGMSSAQALDTLNSELGPRTEQPIRIEAFDSTMDVTPVDLGMTFDAAATVQAAGGRLLNPFSMVQRLFGSVAVDPVVVIDEAVLAEDLAEFAATVTVEPVEPTLTYDGLQPVLTPGEAGNSIDVDASMELVADAFLVTTGPVALPEVSLAPTVSDEVAVQTRDGFATVAVSGPVLIDAGPVTAQVRPETIARSLSFIAVDGRFDHEVNGARIYKSISQDLAPVETPGNDATFQIVNGTPVVVPSQVGEGVADDDLARAVDSVLDKTGDERRASAPITVRDPAITTEMAAGLGVIEEISSFTQQVAYVPYMAHNLALAAEYINGTLLMPGQVFSMNETTENRDPVDGYMEGFVIGPGGVFTRALGGGLSAATTTVWSAAFYAGLEPVEVRAHSIYISRYVPGLEATVAWDYFDMKFKNSMPTAVFITASTTNTTMTVTMYGTKQYTDIKAEVGDRYRVTDFRTIYNTGSNCSAQSGGVGFTIDVDRVFYDGTTEVKRETFTTRYAPSPKVVCGPDPADRPVVPPEEEPDNGNGNGGGGNGGGGGGRQPTPSPTPTPPPTPAPEPDAAQAPQSV